MNAHPGVIGVVEHSGRDASALDWRASYWANRLPASRRASAASILSSLPVDDGVHVQRSVRDCRTSPIRARRAHMKTWDFKAPWSREEGDVRMLAELLDGITVADALQAEALELVRADSEERRLLVTRTHDAHLDEQVKMMRRRDARIRELLSSADDRARFDANAAHADRRRSGDDPWPPPSCARDSR